MPVWLVSVAGLLFVGIFTVGGMARTIGETSQWKMCLDRPPPGCTVLQLSGRSLTGTIPETIGDFTNLRLV